MSRCVWALASVEVADYVAMTHEEKARDWIFALIKRLSKKEITEILVTMWAVWYARRKAIHESIFQSHLSTRCFIERFIADLEVNRNLLLRTVLPLHQRY